MFSWQGEAGKNAPLFLFFLPKVEGLPIEGDEMDGYIVSLSVQNPDAISLKRDC